MVFSFSGNVITRSILSPNFAGNKLQAANLANILYTFSFWLLNNAHEVNEKAGERGCWWAPSLNKLFFNQKSWNFTFGYQANEASHALIIHTHNLCRTHTSLCETQHFRVSHGLFGSTLLSLSNFCIKSCLTFELCMINGNWCHLYGTGWQITAWLTA